MDIPSHLLNQSVSCDCTEVHEIPIEKIVIEKNIETEIGQYLQIKQYRKIVMVADINTNEVCGAKLLEYILSIGIHVRSFIFQQRCGLLPDEEAIEKVRRCVEQDACDTVIAIGGGVINDIVRYVSFGAQLPYVSVPTAPSMDGYASKMAAMQFSGMKLTFPAQTPIAIFADLDVLTATPYPLPHKPRLTDEFVKYVKDFYGEGAREVLSAQRQKYQLIEQSLVGWKSPSVGELRKVLDPTLNLMQDVVTALHIMDFHDNIRAIDVSTSILRVTFQHAK